MTSDCNKCSTCPSQCKTSTNLVSIEDMYVNNQDDCVIIDNDTGQTEKQTIGTRFRNYFKTEFTRQEIIIMAILAFGNFSFGVTTFVPGPFFPTEVYYKNYFTY